MGNLNFQFSGRTVVVTGAAQGIGFQIARQFLGAGAKVAIWDYSDEALAKASQELGNYSALLTIAKVDVSKRESVEAAATKLGWPVDILVNNAGITRDKSFTKMSFEEWDAVISTNLTGLFNVTKCLLEKFNPTNQNRRIINISSIVGIYGNFGQTNYAAAKAGVLGMTKTWAKEMGKKGFTVNAIAPGFINTPMTSGMPKEVLDLMIAKVPTNRIGEPTDIANACLFLASEEAAYINGHVVSVDGALVL